MSPLQVQQAFPLNLAERLGRLYAESGDPVLLELRAVFEGLVAGRIPGEARPLRTSPGEGGGPASEEEEASPKATLKASLEACRDRLSTRLMECFRLTGSREAFSLLYELNARLFLGVISSRLRKFYFSLDPQDVLQEVFFNIYRYPHRFKGDRDQAFRFWASMIIRNTVFKCTKEKDRELGREIQDQEIDSRPDGQAPTPLGEAIREESQALCSRTYVLFLHLYMAAFGQLSARERKALRMVEIEGQPYKVTARALGIRLENLKMVVFRARKKILRMLEKAMASAASSSPGEAAPRRPLRGRGRGRRSLGMGRLRGGRPGLVDGSWDPRELPLPRQIGGLSRDDPKLLQSLRQAGLERTARLLRAEAGEEEA